MSPTTGCRWGAAALTAGLVTAAGAAPANRPAASKGDSAEPIVTVTNTRVLTHTDAELAKERKARLEAERKAVAAQAHATALEAKLQAAAKDAAQRQAQAATKDAAQHQAQATQARELQKSLQDQQKMLQDLQRRVTMLDQQRKDAEADAAQARRQLAALQANADAAERAVATARMLDKARADAEARAAEADRQRVELQRKLDESEAARKADELLLARSRTPLPVPAEETSNTRCSLTLALDVSESLRRTRFGVSLLVDGKEAFHTADPAFARCRLILTPGLHALSIVPKASSKPPAAPYRKEVIATPGGTIRLRALIDQVDGTLRITRLDAD